MTTDNQVLIIDDEPSWVEAAVAQDVRVYETTRQELDPARVLAHRAALSAVYLALDIELEAGLDEREVARSQPDGDVALEDLREQPPPNDADVQALILATETCLSIIRPST